MKLQPIAFLLLALLLPAQSPAADFVHPGILVSKAQLDFVKARKNQEPWATSFKAALASPLANRDYKPSAREIVRCGAYSNPDEGCSDETRDAQAAYLQALLWSYTGDTIYAENVRSILNNWATTLKEHSGDNRWLQASWAAQLFTRAAEIIKYTYPGWPQSEKDNVTRMFREKFLPMAEVMFDPAIEKSVNNNANWHASAIEAMVNIAIFTHDQQTFQKALSRWRSLTSSYIYLKTDGPYPLSAEWNLRVDADFVKQKWSNPSRFIDGMPLEFCRDLPHAGYGLSAIINVAETARIQGVDLYAEQKERITKAMEVMSTYGLDFGKNESDYSAICGKNVSGQPRGTFFIGYNHYGLREGMDLPKTLEFIGKHATYGGQVHYQWERLTHFHVTP